MNPVAVITEALQSLPPAVRKWLLLGYSVLVVLVGVLALVGVGLPYDKITAVLTLVGGYLGVQSAVNVPAKGEGTRVDHTPEHMKE
jgi:hypothetical protein